MIALFEVLPESRKVVVDGRFVLLAFERLLGETFRGKVREKRDSRRTVSRMHWNKELDASAQAPVFMTSPAAAQQPSMADNSRAHKLTGGSAKSQPSDDAQKEELFDLNILFFGLTLSFAICIAS